MNDIKIGWWYLQAGKQKTMGEVYEPIPGFKEVYVGGKRLSVDHPKIKFLCPAPTLDQAIEITGYRKEEVSIDDALETKDLSNENIED